ncbi:hypothetical protein HDU67_004846, partial [Dinochytrium kinnereticum]
MHRETAKKAFLIGKSLNFLRFECNHQAYVINRSKEAHEAKGLEYGSEKALQELIIASYKKTSQYLLDVLFEKYQLLDHLIALKRYLLLGQGDFIQNLMDRLGPDLSKPAQMLFRHNLAGVLESAIRSSNVAQFSLDIVKRLDVRLLEFSPGDTGWDVFALDYHVDPPLSTIFSPQAMRQYLRIFVFLWRLKRLEYGLSSVWKRLVTERAGFKGLPEFLRVLQVCQLIWSEMNHFVFQLQYYILFEVLESSWNDLLQHMRQRSGDLDQLIGAHSKYLSQIVSKAMFATGN